MNNGVQANQQGKGAVLLRRPSLMPRQSIRPVWESEGDRSTTSSLDYYRGREAGQFTFYRIPRRCSRMSVSGAYRHRPSRKGKRTVCTVPFLFSNRLFLRNLDFRPHGDGVGGFNTVEPHALSHGAVTELRQIPEGIAIDDFMGDVLLGVCGHGVNLGEQTWPGR